MARSIRCFLILVCASSTFVACGGNSANPVAQHLPAVVALREPAQTPANLIKHVIIIIQENRTFENLFSGFPHANAPTYGYNGSENYVNAHRPRSLPRTR